MAVYKPPLRAPMSVSGNGDWDYDIYAAYSYADRHGVWEVLTYLRNKGLSIYDYYRDAIPGQSKFKAWLEEGIYNSRTTLVFLTPTSKNDPSCQYQYESATIRSSRTKGRHRIQLVMLKSCHVPKSLRRFNRLYAWRYDQEPVRQQKRIYNAVKGSRSKLEWTTSDTDILQTNAKANQTAEQKARERKSGSANLQILFNLNKVSAVLKECTLKCESTNCPFQCPGTNFTDFHEHMKVCKYKFVTCTNVLCQQKLKRKNSGRHNDRCKYKTSKCPNVNCGFVFTSAAMRKHKLECPHGMIECENSRYGCNYVFMRKEKDVHIKECKYVKLKCVRCSEYFFRVDLKTHTCGHELLKCSICAKDVLRKLLKEHESQCRPTVLCGNNNCNMLVPRGLLHKHELECDYLNYGCENVECVFKGVRKDLEYHRKLCSFRQEPCPDCGTSIAVKNLQFHKVDCDKLITCQQCQRTIPSCTKSSHDKWSCPRQSLSSFCIKCRTCVPAPDLLTHSSICKPYQEPHKLSIIQRMPNDNCPQYQAHTQTGTSHSWNQHFPMKQTDLSTHDDSTVRVAASTGCQNVVKQINKNEAILKTPNLQSQLLGVLKTTDPIDPNPLSTTQTEEDYQCKIRPIHVPSKQKLNDIYKLIESPTFKDNVHSLSEYTSSGYFSGSGYYSSSDYSR